MHGDFLSEKEARTGDFLLLWTSGSQSHNRPLEELWRMFLRIIPLKDKEAGDWLPNFFIQWSLSSNALISPTLLDRIYLDQKDLGGSAKAKLRLIPWCMPEVRHWPFTGTVHRAAPMPRPEVWEVEGHGLKPVEHGHHWLNMDTATLISVFLLVLAKGPSSWATQSLVGSLVSFSKPVWTWPFWLFSPYFV